MKPLKDKVRVCNTRFLDTTPLNGVTVVDVYLKEDIDKRIEFYREYRYDRDTFAKKYPTKYNEFWNWHKEIMGDDLWKCWLFEYCFGSKEDE